jgi:hypothetical protein
MPITVRRLHPTQSAGTDCLDEKPTTRPSNHQPTTSGLLTIREQNDDNAFLVIAVAGARSTSQLFDS